MKKILCMILVTMMMLTAFTACGSTPTPTPSPAPSGPSGGSESATPAESSGSSSGDTEGSGLNTIDWNGSFNGTELPQPDGFPKVCEYTVKDDSVTIRIDGMSYDQYIAYCKKVEALDGWKADEDENVAHFPSDYNTRSKVYCTGAYGNLPHISIQYYSDSTCKKAELPHFCMFMFNEW